VLAHYLYRSAEWLFIVVGLVTLRAGVVAFLLWSARTKQWPFAAQEESAQCTRKGGMDNSACIPQRLLQ
jgi:hypothetical protein